MSWQPVNYVALRCDGDTTTGQCGALLHEPNPYTAITAGGDETPMPVLFEKAPRPHRLYWPAFERCGWLIGQHRVLCPDHVAALERLAEAELDGLPFGE